MTFELPYTKPVFKQQADATINQENPESGTKYEWSSDGTQAKKLGAQKNVRIISVEIECAWTAQPSPLELHITVDGILHTYSKTDPVTATMYFPTRRPELASNDQRLDPTASEIQDYHTFELEGRSVKVEAEITGGTVSNLSMRVKWAKME